MVGHGSEAAPDLVLARTRMHARPGSGNVGFKSAGRGGVRCISAVVFAGGAIFVGGDYVVSLSVCEAAARLSQELDVVSRGRVV